MNWKQSAPARAKINLTLDVGLPRADGYHDIDSVVVPLSISDELTVSVLPGTGRVRLIVKDKRPDRIAIPPIPRGDTNLVHRAAASALAAWSPDGSLDIWCTLVKRLPAEAGLGGGSSDAATALKLLGEAFGKSADELFPLAVDLGSDVSLFLHDGAVRMRGRGELVEPVEGVATLWGVVVRPTSGVPTGPAYALLDRVPGRIPGNATEQLLASPGNPAHCLHNDFQDPVCSAYPDVAAVVSSLREAGALSCLLCGSGSAVFGVAENRGHAVDIARIVAPRFPYVKVVQTQP